MNANKEKPSASLAGALNRHIQRRLISGLFALVPLGLTFLILRLLFNVIAVFLKPMIKPLLGQIPIYVIYILAFLVCVIIVYLVGFITTHVLGRKLFGLAEAILLRIPLVKTVYSASKQLVDVLSTSGSAAFKATVVIEFPRPGCYAVGFVTGSISDTENRAMYKVFVPTTPNPTSGFLLILPREQVIQTTLTVEEGIKMVVSGGVISPERFARLEDQ